MTSLDIEGFCWNKVFKKELFIQNNIYFEENKTAFEDMAIIFDIICKSNSVVLLPYKLYFYRQVDASLTHKQYNRRDEEYYDSMKHIINTANYYGLNKEAYIFFISRSIWQKYNLYKNEFDRKIYRNNKFFVFLSQQINILLYLKSEKIRTILKGIMLRYYQRYEIPKLPI